MDLETYRAVACFLRPQASQELALNRLCQDNRCLLGLQMGQWPNDPDHGFVFEPPNDIGVAQRRRERIDDTAPPAESWSPVRPNLKQRERFLEAVRAPEFARQRIGEEVLAEDRVDERLTSLAPGPESKRRPECRSTVRNNLRTG
jgi:hypothetical protein